MMFDILHHACLIQEQFVCSQGIHLHIWWGIAGFSLCGFEEVMAVCLDIQHPLSCGKPIITQVLLDNILTLQVWPFGRWGCDKELGLTISVNDLDKRPPIKFMLCTWWDCARVDGDTERASCFDEEGVVIVGGNHAHGTKSRTVDLYKVVIGVIKR